MEELISNPTSFGWDRFAPLKRFVDELDLPASVVSEPDGRLIHYNRSLSSYIGLDSGNSTELFRCRWISEQGATCPDCAETPTIEGRCFLARSMERDLKLAAAFRLSNFESALLRLYTPSDLVGARVASAQILQAARFAMPDFESSLSAGSNRDPELTLNIALSDLVDDLLELESLAQSRFQNRIPRELKVSEAHLVTLRRLIGSILIEHKKISEFGAKVITADKFALAGKPTIGVEFALEVSNRRARRVRSAFRSMGLRLSRLRAALMVLGSSSIEPIEIKSLSSRVTTRLFFSDVMISAAPLVFEWLPASWNLSAREEEIVELISSGYSNEELAEELKIKVATVRQHLKSIYRKTNSRSRTELIFSAGRSF